MTAAKWFPLDTVGKLFPAIESTQRTEAFRISAILYENVDSSLLQEALNFTVQRFPYFKVSLNRGFFWYYLEQNNKQPKVEADNTMPSRRIDRKKSNNYLFRIFYKENRISIDFFHAIGDGTAGLTLLKTLTAEYLKRKYSGLQIPYTDGVYNCTETPNAEEFEDAYKRYYKGRLKRKVKMPRVFHLTGKKEPDHIFHVTTGKISIANIKEHTKKLNVSITEYIASILAFSLYNIQKRKKNFHKPIRVSIPINLRQIYPSRTLRNFTLSVTPSIDPNLGDFTFNEILMQMHHLLRYEMNEKFISAMLSNAVFLGNHPLIRITPRIIKNKIMLFAYKNFGENQYSTTISNMGKVTLPESMIPYIERINLNMPPNRINMCSSAMISYGEHLYLTITSVLQEPLLEREVFSFFRKEGISMTLESNNNRKIL